MQQNLNVSRYTDGTPIPQVTNQSQWANLTTGAWCYYDNDTSNGVIYGKLYNWYAVAGIYDAASLANPALRKKLAPTGWHLTSNEEWLILISDLGGDSVAGGKMKQAGTTLWADPNALATNSSGFTGLPGGISLLVEYGINFTTVCPRLLTYQLYRMIGTAVLSALRQGLDSMTI